MSWYLKRLYVYILRRDDASAASSAVPGRCLWQTGQVAVAAPSQGVASGKQSLYMWFEQKRRFHKHDCTGEETTRFLEFRASGGCMGINYI